MSKSASGWTKDELAIIEDFRARHRRGEKWTFDEMAKALKMPVEDLIQHFMQSMEDRGYSVRKAGRVQ